MVNENKSIGKKIASINTHTQIYFMRALSDLKIQGPGQMRIVLTLAKKSEGITQEELARELSVDKGSISRMIHPLIINGVITRKKNSKDKRAYTLTLSKNTAEILPEIEKRKKKWTEIPTDRFTIEEFELLFSFMERMENNARIFIKEQNNEKK